MDPFLFLSNAGAAAQAGVLLSARKGDMLELRVVSAAQAEHAL